MDEGARQLEIVERRRLASTRTRSTDRAWDEFARSLVDPFAHVDLRPWCRCGRPSLREHARRADRSSLTPGG